MKPETEQNFALVTICWLVIASMSCVDVKEALKDASVVVSVVGMLQV
jgi:hypothetical protein